MVMNGHADEALTLVAEIMARAAPDPSGAASAVLHRIRGYALAQRGRTEEAKEAFTASLDAARSLRYEKAITLDALIWLAGHTGQPADTEVLDARAALFGTLGVAAAPTVPFTTRCADPPPERLWCRPRRPRCSCAGTTRTATGHRSCSPAEAPRTHHWPGRVAFRPGR